MTYNNANEVIEENFESLLSRNQIEIETSIRVRVFIFISFTILKML